jgi:5-carboxymethyl-2-hydroxymuconate isomerase
MAHFIVEYTRNIAADADIPALLRKANETLIAQGGVYPIGGVRSRAVELTDWRMADGADDYAFVHATLKIGAGRAPEIRQQTGDALFEMMKAHFADLYVRRYLALSLEIYEFDEAGTWKHNNVHARFRKAPPK